MNCENAFSVVPACFLVIFIGLAILAGLAAWVVVVIAYCKICSKAGYPWALGLLVIVPFGKFILPLILGFSKWPNEKTPPTSQLELSK